MTKILCVDDNDTNLYMISAIVRRAGFEVCTAKDGESGIAAVKAERPDLVLMDVQMPGIDGFEATRRLKAEPATQHIPVITLSAHEREDKEQEIRESGCDAYLTKPVDVRALLVETRRLLEAAGGTQAELPGAPRE